MVLQAQERVYAVRVVTMVEIDGKTSEQIIGRCCQSRDPTSNCVLEIRWPLAARDDGAGERYLMVSGASARLRLASPMP